MKVFSYNIVNKDLTIFVIEKEKKRTILAEIVIVLRYKNEEIPKLIQVEQIYNRLTQPYGKSLYPIYYLQMS